MSVKRSPLIAVVVALAVMSPGCAFFRDYLGIKQTFDKSYLAVLKPRERKSVDIVDFDPKFVARAVKLDKPLKDAFTDFYVRSMGVITKTDGFYRAIMAADYLVALDAADLTQVDLTDGSWGIYMESSSHVRTQVLRVTRIDDRLRARKFFPTVSDWSEVFLLAFPDGGQDGSLNLRGTIGTARFSWIR